MHADIDLIFIDPEEETAPACASAEIITMPNRLKYIAGNGGFDVVKIQNARRVFEKEKRHLEKEGRSKICSLSHLIDRAEKAKSADEKECLLHEMKSLTLVFQSCSGFTNQKEVYDTSIMFLPFIASLGELNKLSLAICKIYNMTIISGIKHTPVKGMSFSSLSKLLSQACNCYLKSQEYGTDHVLEKNFGFLREFAPDAVRYEPDESLC